ncbi:hypothetical protein C0J52_06544 [Blattella germanica]|nr:hypothetical protein C0J52_06544 [Blattella germanica]
MLLWALGCYLAPYNPICPSLFQVSLLHPLLHKPPVPSRFIAEQEWRAARCDDAKSGSANAFLPFQGTAASVFSSDDTLEADQYTSVNVEVLNNSENFVDFESISDLADNDGKVDIHIVKIILKCKEDMLGVLKDKVKFLTDQLYLTKNLVERLNTKEFERHNVSEPSISRTKQTKNVKMFTEVVINSISTANKDQRNAKQEQLTVHPPSDKQPAYTPCPP